MKNKILFFVICIALAFAACKKDEPAPIAKVDVKDVLIDASYRKADIYWRVEANATTQAVVLEYSTDSAFAAFKQVPMIKDAEDQEGNLYQVSLDSLQEGTIYYARSRAINKINSYESVPQIFETKGYELAGISTDSITDITVSSAKLYGTMYNWGTDTMPQIGFCIATHPNVTIEDSCLVYSIEEPKDSVIYSIDLDSLADNTTYYLRAYAKNYKGVAYGEEYKFKTIEILTPQVGNTTITSITYTTAKATCEILSDGGAVVSERGICYAPIPNPTIADTKIANGSGIGSFNCDLQELTAGTTYYVRTYAINCKGTSYGNAVSFTTTEYGLPIINTSAATDISYTTATCGGNITADGGQNVIERGLCYSISPNPTILDTKIASGSGIGAFTCNLSDLANGTSYYVRAYATNSKGTSYGNEVSFTTLTYCLPTIITSAVTDITYTSATCGGEVTDEGGQSVTERGVCYSTTPSPTTANNKISSGSGLGVFTCNLSGLTENTTYYIRAYATNSVGTSYGEAVMFKTTASNPNAVIYYTASEKLPETTTDKTAGLHTNAFKDVTIISHEFSNEEGVIIFSGDLYKILNNAFYGCGSLTSVTIPNSVTSIGNSAFHGCSSLASIIIPNSVTFIGSYAFIGCSSLASINIPDGITSIKVSTFDGCSSLISVTIPNSVTSIEGNAFKGCSSLASINIPNNVTSIGGDAFLGCSNLTSIFITDIEVWCNISFNGSSSSFSSSYNLYLSGDLVTDIVFPNNITKIKNYAFNHCGSLISITIPNSVTSIGNSAFSGCSSLASITIPISVTNIGSSAFYNCSSLTTINIPSSVTSIGDGAFKGCSSLTSVVIPNSVTEIKRSTFYNCGSLTSVTIPDGVTKIGDNALCGCCSLTSINIPNSVTSIGSLAFYGCSSLTSVNIPNSVTSIGGSAFSGCSGLTSVVISSNVAYLNNTTFKGCAGLTSITCKAVTPPTCGVSVFEDVNKSTPLYVPATSVSAYQQASGWMDFTNILPISE